MKNTHRFLIAAAAVALFASAGQARAGSSLCCDDGIAASPKVRAMLDERKARCCMVSQQVTIHQTAPRNYVAASPKVQQMKDGQKTLAVAPRVAPETAGYRTTGDDGITASPKVRAMLDERKQTVEIAPLK